MILENTHEIKLGIFNQVLPAPDAKKQTRRVESQPASQAQSPLSSEFDDGQTSRSKYTTIYSSKDTRTKLLTIFA